jgi:Tol biopolymer transport system component
VFGGEEAELFIPDGEHPRYSPDCRYLMYFSHSQNNIWWALFVQPLAGGSPVELSKGCEFANRAAVWPPESKHILFDGNCQGHRSFWLASVDGARSTEMSDTFDFWKAHNLSPGGTIPAIDDWLTDFAVSGHNRSIGIRGPVANLSWFITFTRQSALQMMSLEAD